VFRGRMKTPAFQAGPESLDVRLFPLSAIPWDTMAFPVVSEALRRYMADAKAGEFRLHLGSLPDKPRF
jgi:hypothetical protein